MRSGPVDYQRLQEMRSQGVPNTEIARILGCSVRTVDGASKRLGDGYRPPGPRKAVPVPQLFALWASSELTKSEVARKLGVTDKQLARLEKFHKLPARPPTYRAAECIQSAPDDFGDPEPPETLDLCPWVAQRIAELRIKEQHLEEKRRQLWEPALS